LSPWKVNAELTETLASGLCRTHPMYRSSRSLSEEI
jgi:hypothetical protein